MKILFCGKDSFTYHRTSVLVEGLKKHPDADCTVFPVSAKDRKNGAELSRLSADADFVLVPAFRHKDVAWVKRYSKAPVVFDPLISHYLTRVIDYGQYYKAPTKFLLDWRTIGKADLLISDTLEMKKYYARNFGVPERNIGVVQDGYISEEFYPRELKRTDARFHVGFYGSFVPLQGTDVIVRAAAILRKEDIVFEIIGAGATFANFESFIRKNGLTNLKLHGWLKHEELPDALAKMDLCLGIFGRSGKANRVVPNKLFHYAAMKKCIITREAAALHEVFTPGKDIVAIGCSPEKLAEEIMSLRSDTQRRNGMAEGAFRTISSGYNEIKIADALLAFLKGAERSGMKKH